MDSTNDLVDRSIYKRGDVLMIFSPVKNSLFVTTSVVAALGSLALATSASAGVYTYMVRAFDADLGTNHCSAIMADAAAKFAEATGHQVLSHGCEVDTLLSRINGKIVYSAPKSVSTWSTSSTTFGDEREFYTSRASCQEALTREIDLFRSMTQLTPMISLCHKVSSVGAPRYRTRIDAIGTSPVRRFETTAPLDYPLAGAQQIVDQLNQQGRDLGLVPIAWHQSQSVMQRGLSVAYYADLPGHDSFRLLGKDSLFFATHADCETARTAFQATRGTDWVGVTGCGAAHPTVGFQFNLVWWDKGISADSIIQSTLLPEVFTTVAECRQSASVLARQLSDSGEKVVGILCGRERETNSPIRMELMIHQDS